MSRSDSKKDTARTLIHRADTEQWTAWQLVSAIARECGCTLLQAHRLARGVTLDTTRAELEAVGAHVSVQQLSAWETGRGRPGDPNLDHLCRYYETRPDRLGYGRDYTPNSEAAPHESVAVADQRPTPDLGETGPGPLPRTALGALVTARRSMATALESPLSETVLDQWERQAAEYGYAYQVAPPARLLRDSVADLAEIRALLERRQSVDSRTRLCRVAAQLAATAGIALVALGEPREARAWFRVAQLAADETGDRALRAWLFAREAVIPFYYGAPAAAQCLAERARLLAGSIACATSAWAPSLEARALARMGRRREAQDAMRLAHTAFDRLSAAETSDTAYGYTRRQLVWHEGSMWTTIGDTRRAQASLQFAHDLYSPDEHLDQALISMDEATCLVGVGEVSVACHETTQVLTRLPAEHLTGIVVNRARDLLAALPARSRMTSAVGDLRELVEVQARPAIAAG